MGCGAHIMPATPTPAQPKKSLRHYPPIDNAHNRRWTPDGQVYYVENNADVQVIRQPANTPDSSYDSGSDTD